MRGHTAIVAGAQANGRADGVQTGRANFEKSMTCVEMEKK